jgi:hypothetical protein
LRTRIFLANPRTPNALGDEYLGVVQDMDDESILRCLATRHQIAGSYGDDGMRNGRGR